MAQTRRRRAAAAAAATSKFEPTADVENPYSRRFGKSKSPPRKRGGHRRPSDVKEGGGERPLHGGLLTANYWRPVSPVIGRKRKGKKKGKGKGGVGGSGGGRGRKRADEKKADGGGGGDRAEESGGGQSESVGASTDDLGRSSFNLTEGESSQDEGSLGSQKSGGRESGGGGGGGGVASAVVVRVRGPLPPRDDGDDDVPDDAPLQALVRRPSPPGGGGEGKGLADPDDDDDVPLRELVRRPPEHRGEGGAGGGEGGEQATGGRPPDPDDRPPRADPVRSDSDGRPLIEIIRERRVAWPGAAVPPLPPPPPSCAAVPPPPPPLPPPPLPSGVTITQCASFMPRGWVAGHAEEAAERRARAEDSLRSYLEEHGAANMAGRFRVEVVSVPRLEGRRPRFDCYFHHAGPPPMRFRSKLEVGRFLKVEEDLNAPRTAAQSRRSPPPPQSRRPGDRSEHGGKSVRGADADAEEDDGDSRPRPAPRTPVQRPDERHDGGGGPAASLLLMKIPKKKPAGGGGGGREDVPGLSVRKEAPPKISQKVPVRSSDNVPVSLAQTDTLTKIPRKLKAPPKSSKSLPSCDEDGALAPSASAEAPPKVPRIPPAGGGDGTPEKRPPELALGGGGKDGPGPSSARKEAPPRIPERAPARGRGDVPAPSAQTDGLPKAPQTSEALPNVSKESPAGDKDGVPALSASAGALPKVPQNSPAVGTGDEPASSVQTESLPESLLKIPLKVMAKGKDDFTRPSPQTEELPKVPKKSQASGEDDAPALPKVPRNPPAGGKKVIPATSAQTESLRKVPKKGAAEGFPDVPKETSAKGDDRIPAPPQTPERAPAKKGDGEGNGDCDRDRDRDGSPRNLRTGWAPTGVPLRLSADGYRFVPATPTLTEGRSAGPSPPRRRADRGSQGGRRCPPPLSRTNPIASVEPGGITPSPERGRWGPRVLGGSPAVGGGGEGDIPPGVSAREEPASSAASVGGGECVPEPGRGSCADEPGRGSGGGDVGGGEGGNSAAEDELVGGNRKGVGSTTAERHDREGHDMAPARLPEALAPPGGGNGDGDEPKSPPPPAPPSPSPPRREGAGAGPGVGCGEGASGGNDGGGDGAADVSAFGDPSRSASATGGPGGSLETARGGGAARWGPALRPELLGTEAGVGGGGERAVRLPSPPSPLGPAGDGPIGDGAARAKAVVVAVVAPRRRADAPKGKDRDPATAGGVEETAARRRVCRGGAALVGGGGTGAPAEGIQGACRDGAAAADSITAALGPRGHGAPSLPQDSGGDAGADPAAGVARGERRSGGGGGSGSGTNLDGSPVDSLMEGVSGSDSSDVDGSDYDDIDGVPLDLGEGSGRSSGRGDSGGGGSGEDLDGSPLKEDVDMNEDEEDLDGSPLSSSFGEEDVPYEDEEEDASAVVKSGKESVIATATAARGKGDGSQGDPIEAPGGEGATPPRTEAAEAQGGGAAPQGEGGGETPAASAVRSGTAPPDPDGRAAEADPAAAGAPGVGPGLKAGGPPPPVPKGAAALPVGEAGPTVAGEGPSLKAGGPPPPVLKGAVAAPPVGEAESAAAGVGPGPPGAGSPVVRAGEPLPPPVPRGTTATAAPPSPAAAAAKAMEPAPPASVRVGAVGAGPSTEEVERDGRGGETPAAPASLLGPSRAVAAPPSAAAGGGGGWAAPSSPDREKQAERRRRWRERFLRASGGDGAATAAAVPLGWARAASLPTLKWVPPPPKTTAPAPEPAEPEPSDCQRRQSDPIMKANLSAPIWVPPPRVAATELKVTPESASAASAPKLPDQERRQSDPAAKTALGTCTWVLPPRVAATEFRVAPEPAPAASAPKPRGRERENSDPTVTTALGALKSLAKKWQKRKADPRPPASRATAAEANVSPPYAPRPPPEAEAELLTPPPPVLVAAAGDGVGGGPRPPPNSNRVQVNLRKMSSTASLLDNSAVAPTAAAEDAPPTPTEEPATKSLREGGEAGGDGAAVGNPPPPPDGPSAEATAASKGPKDAPTHSAGASAPAVAGKGRLAPPPGEAAAATAEAGGTAPPPADSLADVLSPSPPSPPGPAAAGMGRGALLAVFKPRAVQLRFKSRSSPPKSGARAAADERGGEPASGAAAARDDSAAAAGDPLPPTDGPDAGATAASGDDAPARSAGAPAAAGEGRSVPPPGEASAAAVGGGGTVEGAGKGALLAAFNPQAVQMRIKSRSSPPKSGAGVAGDEREGGSSAAPAAAGSGGERAAPSAPASSECNDAGESVNKRTAAVERPAAKIAADEEPKAVGPHASSSPCISADVMDVKKGVVSKRNILLPADKGPLGDSLGAVLDAELNETATFHGEGAAVRKSPPTMAEAMRSRDAERDGCSVSLTGAPDTEKFPVHAKKGGDRLARAAGSTIGTKNNKRKAEAEVAVSPGNRAGSAVKESTAPPFPPPPGPAATGAGRGALLAAFKPRAVQLRIKSRLSPPSGSAGAAADEGGGGTAAAGSGGAARPRAQKTAVSTATDAARAAAPAGARREGEAPGTDDGKMQSECNDAEEHVHKRTAAVERPAAEIAVDEEPKAVGPHASSSAGISADVVDVKKGVVSEKKRLLPADKGPLTLGVFLDAELNETTTSHGEGAAVQRSPPTVAEAIEPRGADRGGPPVSLMGAPDTEKRPVHVKKGGDRPAHAAGSDSSVDTDTLECVSLRESRPPQPQVGTEEGKHHQEETFGTKNNKKKAEAKLAVSPGNRAGSAVKESTEPVVNNTDPTPPKVRPGSDGKSTGAGGSVAGSNPGYPKPLGSAQEKRDVASLTASVTGETQNGKRAGPSLPSVGAACTPASDESKAKSDGAAKPGSRTDKAAKESTGPRAEVCLGSNGKAGSTPGVIELLGSAPRRRSAEAPPPPAIGEAQNKRGQEARASFDQVIGTSPDKGNGEAAHATHDGQGKDQNAPAPRSRKRSLSEISGNSPASTSYQRTTEAMGKDCRTEGDDIEITYNTLSLKRFCPDDSTRDASTDKQSNRHMSALKQPDSDKSGATEGGIQPPSRSLSPSPSETSFDNSLLIDLIPNSTRRARPVLARRAKTQQQQQQQPLPIGRTPCPLCGDLFDPIDITYHASQCAEVNDRLSTHSQSSSSLGGGQAARKRRASAVPSRVPVAPAMMPVAPTPSAIQKTSMSQPPAVSSPAPEAGTRVSHVLFASYGDKAHMDTGAKKRPTAAKAKKRTRDASDTKKAGNISHERDRKNFLESQDWSSDREVHQKSWEHQGTGESEPCLQSRALLSEHEALPPKTERAVNLSAKKEQALLEKRRKKAAANARKDSNFNERLIRETLKADVAIQGSFPSVIGGKQDGLRQKCWLGKRDARHFAALTVPVTTKPYASIHDARRFLEQLRHAASKRWAEHGFASQGGGSASGTIAEASRPTPQPPNAVVFQCLSYINQARSGKCSTFQLMRKVKSLIVEVTGSQGQGSGNSGGDDEHALKSNGLMQAFEAFLPPLYRMHKVIIGENYQHTMGLLSSQEMSGDQAVAESDAIEEPKRPSFETFAPQEQGPSAGTGTGCGPDEPTKKKRKLPNGFGLYENSPHPLANIAGSSAKRATIAEPTPKTSSVAPAPKMSSAPPSAASGIQNPLSGSAPSTQAATAANVVMPLPGTVLVGPPGTFSHQDSEPIASHHSTSDTGQTSQGNSTDAHHSHNRTVAAPLANSSVHHQMPHFSALSQHQAPPCSVEGESACASGSAPQIGTANAPKTGPPHAVLASVANVPPVKATAAAATATANSNPPCTLPNSQHASVTNCLAHLHGGLVHQQSPPATAAPVNVSNLAQQPDVIYVNDDSDNDSPVTPYTASNRLQPTMLTGNVPHEVSGEVDQMGKTPGGDQHCKKNPEDKIWRNSESMPSGYSNGRVNPADGARNQHAVLSTRVAPYTVPQVMMMCGSNAAGAGPNGIAVGDSHRKPHNGSTKPSKPCNPFTHFCRIVKPSLQVEFASLHPSLSENRIRAMVQEEARARWRSLKEEERKKYLIKSGEDHARYHEEVKRFEEEQRMKHESTF